MQLSPVVRVQHALRLQVCCARAACTAPAGLVSTWAALYLRGTGINEGTDNQGMR